MGFPDAPKLRNNSKAIKGHRYMEVVNAITEPSLCWMLLRRPYGELGSLTDSMDRCALIAQIRGNLSYAYGKYHQSETQQKNRKE